MPSKHYLQIIAFMVVFALVIAGISALINQYLNPADHPFIQQLLAHQKMALLFYFAYTVAASVIVPIPTLPIDVVLLNLIDPWSVIVVRLAGGVAGGAINFYLARRYGRPLLKRWFSKKNYQLIENLSRNL